ncbi:ISNCY family transposase [Bacteroides ovatus]|nr:ISNCY family transposase [Bacteroides ovatus]
MNSSGKKVVLFMLDRVHTIKRRCVKMHTFCFLRTKPRLSQAGALLLPKDFVSLGIRISL